MLTTLDPQRGGNLFRRGGVIMLCEDIYASAGRTRSIRWLGLAALAYLVYTVFCLGEPYTRHK